MLAVSNQKLNPGFELSNKFNFSNHWFFKTGIRYNQYRTLIEGVNQFSGRSNHPPPFYWEKRYESLAVPTLFGKELFTQQGRKAELYLGGSFGVLMTSAIEGGTSTGIWEDPNAGAAIEIQTRMSPDNLPVYFFPTLDFGGSYCPFRSQRWGLGFLLSIQLNHTSPCVYSASIRNKNTGENYQYQITHSQQVYNCSFLLTYSFLKRAVDRQKYMLDLPKTN